MNKVVNFSFTTTVLPETQREILETIRSWPGVDAAAHLRPQARSATVQRMAFVRLSDNADTNALLQRIEALPATEQVSIPAERMLLGTSEG